MYEAMVISKRGKLLLTDAWVFTLGTVAIVITIAYVVHAACVFRLLSTLTVLLHTNSIAGVTCSCGSGL